MSSSPGPGNSSEKGNALLVESSDGSGGFIISNLEEINLHTCQK
jgi:hypothetical protein